MNADLYEVNLENGSLAYVGSKSFTILASGATLANEIDVFGIKNNYNSNATYRYIRPDFDNLYFSTEGPNQANVPLPFTLVPEPATMALLSLGLMLIRRRK